MNIRSLALVAAPLLTLFVPDIYACSAPTAIGKLSGSALLLRGGSQALSAQMDNAGQENSRDDGGRPSLVGMWIIGFYLDGTNELWDSGLQQFHSDGTEVTTSSFVPPMQDNTCYGVWESTGRRTFRLNHVGLNYENNKFNGLFKLRVSITISRDGKSYAGTFEADQEDLAGNNIPALHFTGTLKAERFGISSRAALPATQ